MMYMFIDIQEELYCMYTHIIYGCLLFLSLYELEGESTNRKANNCMGIVPSDSDLSKQMDGPTYPVIFG